MPWWLGSAAHLGHGSPERGHNQPPSPLLPAHPLPPQVPIAQGPLHTPPPKPAGEAAKGEGGPGHLAGLGPQPHRGAVGGGGAQLKGGWVGEGQWPCLPPGTLARLPPPLAPALSPPAVFILIFFSHRVCCPLCKYHLVSDTEELSPFYKYSYILYR